MNIPMKYISLVFVLILTAVYSTGLSAQPDNELPSEEVNIEKQFDAVLRDATKKPTSPKLPAVDTTLARDQKYRLSPQLLILDYEAPDIRPLAMRRPPKDPVYRFYTKAGIGYPLSPYAEVLFNSGASQEFNFNAAFKHHSMNANPRVENQRFANNLAKIGGTYYFDQGFAVGGDLGFTVDQYHFYGYNDEDTSITKDAALQRFTNVFGKFDFFNSLPTQGDFDYHASLNFYTMGDHFDSNEHSVGGKAGISKWFAERHLVELKLSDQIVNFNDTITQTNNLLEFEPSLSTNFGLVKIRIGAYLGYDGEFRPYPDLEVLANLMDGKLQIFAGWNGEIRQNSFRKITNYNPFIASKLTLNNTQVQNRYGGVKGQVKSFSYELRGAHRPAESLLMYLNDYGVDSTRFVPVYDDVSIINVHGTLTLTPIKDLDIFFSGDFNSYSTDTLAEAWHLPQIEGNAGFHYKYKEKFGLTGNLYFADGAKFQDKTGAVDELNVLFDLNFGATYLVQKNFSVFLDVNNIIGSKYRRWNAYPQVGFNVMGGVILKL